MDEKGGTAHNLNRGQTSRVFDSPKTGGASQVNPGLVFHFNKRKINDLKGSGLIAKTLIPYGNTIFQDTVMVLKETLEGCSSSSEYDLMVSQEVRTRPKDWVRLFFALPAPEETQKGKFAARFDNGSLTFNSRGLYFRVLGLIAAGLNHACVPNSTITLIERSPDDGGPYLLCVACKDIYPEEEITIAYEFLLQHHEARQALTKAWFGFQCACNNCLHPKVEIEGNFGYISTVYPVIIEPQLIMQEPARVLKLCQALIVAHFAAGIVDYRWANLLDHCAYVTAFHSDAGRAVLFLRTARKIYSLIEGTDGPNYNRTKSLLQDVTKIPSFGTTSKGLSKKEDAAIIGRLEGPGLWPAFMVNVPNNGYLRLCDVDSTGCSVWTEATTFMDTTETPEDSDDTIDVNELINELQAEKRNLDTERQGGPSSTKKRSKRR